MDIIIYAPLLAVICLVGMLLMLEIGRRAGRRQLARDPEKAMAGVGVIDGALFALFGLLIAFTFSGAASRWDSRRQLIAEEANDIGTAYLRLDLLPADDQPALRMLFRNYVDSRLTIYRKLPDIAAAKAEVARSEGVQREIWDQAVAATRKPGAHADAAKLLLPSLNSMIDIATTRNMTAIIHPPLVVYALLFALALGCSLLAGYSMAEEKNRNWLHILAFAVLVSVSLFVILDVEYPRAGLLRLDKYDWMLARVLESMK